MKLSCRDHDHALPFAYDLFRVTYLIWNQACMCVWNQACTCVHMHTEDPQSLGTDEYCVIVFHGFPPSVVNIRQRGAVGRDMSKYTTSVPSDCEKIANICDCYAMIFQAPSFAFTTSTTNYTVPSPDLNLTPLAAFLRFYRAQRGSDRTVLEIRGWTATREMNHIEPDGEKSCTDSKYLHHLWRD